MHLYPHRALLDGAEIEIFKLLFYGATPEQWSEWLRAPLEHAAARGDFDLVERLLKAGASGRAGWRGCRGRTLLDAAALGGNGDVVSALLRAGCGPDVNVVSVSSRRSALHLSAVCGHEAAARKLMMAGANIHLVDQADQCTPFHVAAAGGHQDLVGNMLIGGACPNLPTRFGRTPLHIAAALGDNDVMSVLLGNAGTDFDAIDNDGFSPLMLASEKGHLSAAETLLGAGADACPRASCTNNQRCSALDLASEAGHADVINAIIEHGADVNAAGRIGKTALHRAAQFDQAGSVDALLDAGADVGVKDIGGRTPLHLAACGSCNRAVLALLKHGGNVNETTTSGFTPLHTACHRRAPGVEAIVDILLRWGASETAATFGGNKTPSELLRGVAGSPSCSATEAERVRVLLARAPMDRAWRRRCWPVMLRSRAERERMAHSTDISSSVETEDGSRGVLGDGEGSRRRTGDGGGGSTTTEREQDAEGSGRGAAAAGVGGLSGLVEMLVGMQSDGVFRTIMGYL